MPAKETAQSSRIMDGAPALHLSSFLAFARQLDKAIMARKQTPSKTVNNELPFAPIKQSAVWQPRTTGTLFIIRRTAMQKSVFSHSVQRKKAFE